MWLRGYSRSLQLVPLESLGAVYYSTYIITMAESVAICEILCCAALATYSINKYSASKNGVTLKTGLGFVHGHWK